MSSLVVEDDTIIESIFLKKTEERADGKQLRKQWAADKKYYSQITETTVLDFENYSMHDFSHSKTILNAIAMLLGKDKLEKLSVGDLWLLLEVAYAHDIGMALDYDALNYLWTKDEDFLKYVQDSLSSSEKELKKMAEYIGSAEELLLEASRFVLENKSKFDIEWPLKLKRTIVLMTNTYIRKKHAELSKKAILNYGKNNNVEVESRLYSVIAEISALHTKEFKDIFSLPYEEICFQDCYIHPQFIAALLRMGDLLDMDNNRFKDQILKHFGELPYLSKLHFEKHRALKHFNISPKQIMAIAESSDIETCNVIDCWFNWLKQENTDIISYWNMIAPPDLGGCSLNMCNLKIIYNGDEFTSNNSNTIEIDKKYISKLLIGNNIYPFPLTFIREYFQNALDATKLEFFNELKSGKLDYLINYEADCIGEYVPFSFAEEAFNQLHIEIKLEIVNNALEITIIDKGIGIERDALESLTTIGGGWKRRKDYCDSIEKMPLWLRPTGGFGLGIQTAFLVTNKVEFITKNRSETKGMHIIMNAPDSDGSVTVSNKSVVDNGTSIKIAIPLMTMLKKETYSQKYPIEIQEYSPHIQFVTEKDKIADFFENYSILINIADWVKKYIEFQMPGSLFPIVINAANRKDTIYSYWYQEDSKHLKEFTPYYLEKEKYYYYMSKKIPEIYVFNVQDCVMTYLNFSKDSNHVFKFLYKGIGVTDEYKLCDGFDGFIDIYSEKVHKCLTISRCQFTKEFDQEKIFNNHITSSMRIYAHLLKQTISSCEDSWRTIFKEDELQNIILAFLQYIYDTTEAKEFIEFAFDNLEFKSGIISFVTQLQWKNTEPIKDGTDEKEIKRMGSLRSLKGTVGYFINACISSYLGRSQLIVEMKKDSKISTDVIMYISENEYMIKYNDYKEREKLWNVLHSKETKCFTDDTIIDKQSENKKKVLALLDVIFKDNNCIVDIGNALLKVYGIRAPLIKEEVNYGIINFTDLTNNSRVRYSFLNPKEYEKLHIRTLPFGDRQFDNKTWYLLAPISPHSLYKIEDCCKSNVKFSEYIEVYNEPEKEEFVYLNRYIIWVYENQKTPYKYTSQEIHSECIRFIKDYYSYLETVYKKESSSDDKKILESENIEE